MNKSFDLWSSVTCLLLFHIIYLQYLIAIVIDDFDGDLAGGGWVEGTAGGGIHPA